MPLCVAAMNMREMGRAHDGTRSTLFPYTTLFRSLRVVRSENALDGFRRAAVAERFVETADAAVRRRDEHEGDGKGTRRNTIYTLSLHDALPISACRSVRECARRFPPSRRCRTFRRDG